MAEQEPWVVEPVELVVDIVCEVSALEVAIDGAEAKSHHCGH